MISSSLRFLSSYLISCSYEFCLNLIKVRSKLFFCFIIFQCQKHQIWILAFIRKLFLVLSKSKNSQGSCLFPNSLLFPYVSDRIALTPTGRLCSVLYAQLYVLFALVDAFLMSFFCKWICLSQFSHLDVWKLSSWWGNAFGSYFIVHLPLNFVLSFPSLLLCVYVLQDFLLFIFKSVYNLLTWTMCSCTSASLKRFFFSISHFWLWLM